ncbi:MAG TPA: energy-coupling factor transporter ATPase [Anaerolineaceae bacterium]|nr:energy-coupling factor transporter ATPase [Anaerolineaceae bacterium]
MPPLIQFDHVTYRHPGSGQSSLPALNDISISVEKGEWVAIVGANGSGKTTFARHCNALLLPTHGQVLIDGKSTAQATHLPQIRARIGMVFQNPEDQIVATLIDEDTAFGPENLAISPPEIRERVTSALTTVKMLERKDRPPHLLSAGQKQRVALAGVLAMQPECVIFDESTAMLDPRGRLDVMAEMQSLHDRGITVLFITHFMEEAARANRVIALNKGNLVFDGAPKAIFADLALLKACGLEQPSTLLLLNEIKALDPQLSNLSMDFEQAMREIPPYQGSFVRSEEKNNQSGAETLIAVESLDHYYLRNTPLEQQALFDISLEVKSGLAHGFCGATGSGKSTLLQHLNGLYRPQSGEVRIGPYSLSDPNVDIRAVRRYAGLVFQNPEIYFFEQYVGDEIAYGPKMLYGKEGLAKRVRDAMELVGLDFEAFKDRVTYTLSGGEKRKVALAATMALQPRLLILDEPTAGLDPASRRNLHGILADANKKGIELILSSHSMGDITELTQNLTILSNGRAMRTGNTADLFNDAQLINEASLGQPSVVRLAVRMRERGWPIPQRVVKAEQLFSALRAMNGGQAHG